VKFVNSNKDINQSLKHLIETKRQDYISGKINTSPRHTAVLIQTVTLIPCYANFTPSVMHVVFRMCTSLAYCDQLPRSSN